MRDTGFTRKVDDLGRLAIPAVLARKLDIKHGDYIYSYIAEDKYIVLSKNINSLGVKRKIDTLGRYVVPRDFLNKFNCDIKQAFEIYIENNDIYLKIYSMGCVFCKEVKSNIYYKDKYVCESCLKDLKSR